MLDPCRTVIDVLLPGLDSRLAELPRADLESPGGPAIKEFLDAGGVSLLVPAHLSGLGCSARDAIAVQTALGARSGSLAVATTMHHFSVASLLALTSVSTSGLEGILLQAVAEQRHLLASGFAEGRPERGILSPTMAAEPAEGGLVVTGVKKPCSLASSMTMLTASVAVPVASGAPEVAVVLVPADSPGLSVEPFWGTPVLAGAESEAVRLNRVHVPEALVVRTELTPGEALDTVHRVGFSWFELLMTAAYLGVAAGLCEQALQAVPAAADVLAGDLGTVTTVAAALAELAGQLDGGQCDDALLARLLLVRFHLQDQLPALAGRCLEALGGMAFVATPEVANRAATVHALSFHPPSRRRVRPQLAAALAGSPLVFE